MKYILTFRDKFGPRYVTSEWVGYCGSTDRINEAWCFTEERANQICKRWPDLNIIMFKTLKNWPREV